MNYGYAPFMRPIQGYYNPSIPNGYDGQNMPLQGQANSSLPITTSSLPHHNDTMLWVLGQNEAESYPVAPNCQVVLWDKNAPTIYVKSMSANGVPNMRTLDFVERTETPQNMPVGNAENLSDKYVAIDEFNAVRAEIEDLRSKYAELMQKRDEKTEEKPKMTVRKSKGGDE